MIVAKTTINGIEVTSIALEKGESISNACESLGVSFPDVDRISTMWIGDLDDGADYEDWSEFETYQPEHAKALIAAGAKPDDCRMMIEIRN